MILSVLDRESLESAIVIISKIDEWWKQNNNDPVDKTLGSRERIAEQIRKMTPAENNPSTREKKEASQFPLPPLCGNWDNDFNSLSQWNVDYNVTVLII